MKDRILNESSKEKLSSLSFPLQIAASYLVECLDSLLNGKCNESDIANSIAQINDNSNGKYANEDLMNYDESGKVLGFGTNRNALKRFLDVNGVKQVIMNNHKVGFPRKSILALRDKMIQKQ